MVWYLTAHCYIFVCKSSKQQVWNQKLKSSGQNAVDDPHKNLDSTMLSIEVIYSAVKLIKSELQYVGNVLGVNLCTELYNPRHSKGILSGFLSDHTVSKLRRLKYVQNKSTVGYIKLLHAISEMAIKKKSTYVNVLYAIYEVSAIPD